MLGTNSLSQSLTALPAPSEREPLAKPETLHLHQKLCRHAKGPISEGLSSECETGGVQVPFGGAGERSETERVILLLTYAILYDI